MALNADNAFPLILIPVLIIAAVLLIKKKTVKSDRYVKMSTFLRILTVIVLIFSMSGISVVDKARDNTTLFLTDISDSTKTTTQKVASFIDEAQSNKKNGDKTAVTVFGSRPATIVPPTTEYTTINLDAPSVGKENTNIETAVKLASSVYDDDTKKRLVLITDGAETKGDVLSLRNMLKSENIQTLIYDISNSVDSEAGLREISLPQYVNINMEYDVNVIIDSIGSQSAEFRLYRGTTLVVNETISLKDGENRYVFTDKAVKGGGITYHAEISPEKDTFYQNNSAYGYCYAENLPSVLIIGSNERAENMKKILESAQLNVVAASPSEAPMNYDSLIAYDTVVLADTSYKDLSEDFINSLESYVKYAGGGLIVTGGENSFGPGEYSGTVLEDILPVDMNIKTQSEDPDLSMIMVIDRSGSMADGSQGISCMDLAKEAAFRGVQELEDDDMVGVIAFDSQAQWVVEMTKVGGNVDSIGESIGTIQAGGGTSILPALRMACTKLADTDTKIKHIILLTDGQAEQTGYDSLLNQAREDGITISTIAVGQGADAKLLQYIAEQGGGRYYFADQYSSLPEIFVYETTIASKDYLNNDDFYPVAADSSEITDNIASVPMLHGYVSTTAKSRADVVLESDKEEPVLATWQYGLGRTAAWTSDLSGQWSNDWLASDEGTQILRNLVSYTMRNDVIYDVDVTGEASDGISTVTAKIPVNSKTNGVTATVLTQEGKEYNINMSASAPGEFVGTIPTDVEGAYIITLTETLSDGEENVYNTGFIIGYSNEYDTRNINDNGVIDELVSYDGISLISSPDEVYSSELPDTFAKRDISVPLVITALILLLIDILLRRFPEITDSIAEASYKLKIYIFRFKNNKSESLMGVQKSTESEETKVKKASNKTSKSKDDLEVKSSASKLANIKRNRKK